MNLPRHCEISARKRCEPATTKMRLCCWKSAIECNLSARVAIKHSGIRCNRIDSKRRVGKGALFARRAHVDGAAVGTRGQVRALPTLPTAAPGQNEPCHALRRHGRSTSISGPAGPAVGTSGSGQNLTHAVQQNRPLHSITSSARSKIDGGTVRPSALAVLRFTTISNLVGYCTGRSPGLSPRRMRSTQAAARRKLSVESGP